MTDEIVDPRMTEIAYIFCTTAQQSHSTTTSNPTSFAVMDCDFPTFDPIAAPLSSLGGVYYNNYSHVVQMSEQRVYGRYTCGTVRVVILTETHKIPTEHKPIPGGRSHKTLIDWH
jgi:hypothetical protein